MTKQKAIASQSVIIEQPKRMGLTFRIKGTADLIQNCFSQKAVEQMLRKHMGLSVQREAKKPSECIESATIRNVEGKVCIPPTAIKKAILTASTEVKTFKKTQLRTQLFVVGRSIPITFSTMQPRMDMVRTSGMSRTPDVRFRPAFQDWSADFEIEFSSTIDAQSVTDLVQRAGRIGIGEWRPEKDGTFGTFELLQVIADPKEIKAMRRNCAVALQPLVIPEWAMDLEIDPELLRRIAQNEEQPEE